MSIEVRPANFAIVDNILWRGARPNASQARWLVDCGIKTIINLEWEQSDDKVFQRLPIFAGSPVPELIRLADFEPLPWFGRSLEDRHIILVLAVIRRARRGVYIHCRSGQNRTGVAVAAWRLIERQDSLDRVLEDFRSYRGFWAWGDARYIVSLDRRRDEIARRVDGAKI